MNFILIILAIFFPFQIKPFNNKSKMYNKVFKKISVLNIYIIIPYSYLAYFVKIKIMGSSFHKCGPVLKW